VRGPLCRPSAGTGLIVRYYSHRLPGGGFYSTFIAIPLSVFGADSTDRERKHVNGYALVFGAVIAVPMALVCVGACIFLRRAALSPLVVLAMFSWLL
jgi:hypothetical protein